MVFHPHNRRIELTKPVALVTNALQFAGPPAVESLRKAGFQLVVHDVAFVSSVAQDDYRSANPGVVVLACQTPVEIVESAWAVSNRLDVLVSNDAYRPILGAIEDAGMEDLQATLDRLVVFPFGIARAAIPLLKAQQKARICPCKSEGNPSASTIIWRGRSCPTVKSVHAVLPAIATGGCHCCNRLNCSRQAHVVSDIGQECPMRLAALRCSTTYCSTQQLDSLRTSRRTYRHSPHLWSCTRHSTWDR